VQSPWVFVHTAMIPPGCGIGLHGHTACEEMGITVGGGMQFGHNGRVRQCAGAAAAPCRKGECHSLYNHTAQPTRWFSVKVAFSREPSTCGQEFDGPADALRPLDADADVTQTPLETPDAEQVPVGRLARELLQPQASMHGGKGVVLSRQVCGPRDMQSNLAQLEHLVLPAGTSIGYCVRESVEGIYIVVQGDRARMTVADETFDVRPDDVMCVAYLAAAAAALLPPPLPLPLPLLLLLLLLLLAPSGCSFLRKSVTTDCIGACRYVGAGESSGLFNPGPEDAELVRVGVSLMAERDVDPRQPLADTIRELGDDLSRR
jgi:mannose-6-phosphate isomerase-like protein (cupin superfamily)